MDLVVQYIDRAVQTGIDKSTGMDHFGFGRYCRRRARSAGTARLRFHHARAF
ncbi:hypothetical protein J7E88_31680 [Streptomyces sp. ISL-10]|nr:hypothetical protein [Streptomyces sp. ISL-10]